MLIHVRISHLYIFFFFNDTATTEIYPLSLHDALPISARHDAGGAARPRPDPDLYGVGARLQKVPRPLGGRHVDRKSTRLNSSHANISYAVFCLKKKKKKKQQY